jgi:putative ABC transport system ATP-binding protein
VRAAVRATGVAKAFRDGETDVQVLNGVDLILPCGGMSFLVGPSGCGKTTLVSIMSGILRASSGSVEVFGTRLAGLKSAELARFRARTIGFVFQQFNLLGALTAVENAAVPLLIQGVKGAEARVRSAALLERLGLGPQLHKLPAQLSGGQQQRVAIARALVHDPQLVVCDEPTASLDAEAGQVVVGLLRSFAARADRCVVVVTHDDRIMGHADLVAVMEDGRIRRIDRPA